jgi:hypothetical protein
MLRDGLNCATRVWPVLIESWTDQSSLVCRASYRKTGSHVSGRTLSLPSFSSSEVEIFDMISLEDCLGLCDLSREEILAIAEHEHLPEIAAAALGHYLVHSTQGPGKLFAIITDDIRAAQARGDKSHVLALLHVLHHFLKAHPDAQPDWHPWSGHL